MTPFRPRCSLPPVVAAMAALLLASGCTGSDPQPASSATSGSASAPAGASPTRSPSSTPTPTRTPEPPEAPQGAGCYRLTGSQLTRPTSSAPAVPCDSRHTTHTIFVGTLDTVVRGHAVGVDSAVAQRQLATTCPRRLASYVGGSTEARDLSRLNVVWFSPTIAQAARGARWFRCDVVAFGRGDALLPLPRKKGVLKGALSRSDGLDTFGLCGTEAPGSPGFERVACSLEHTWRAFATIPLAGGPRYPGAATVRKAGDDACKDRARARAADSLKFRYGWEWPSADQWTAGRHFGYCWIPA